MQNPEWRHVLAGKAIEASLVEPVSLTSAQRSLPSSAADFTTEAVPSQRIPTNGMVREGSIQDALTPLAHDGRGFAPSMVELIPDRGRRTSPDCPAPHAPPFRRNAAELDQAHPVRVHSETELGEPLPKVVQERVHRPHILKALGTLK